MGLANDIARRNSAVATEAPTSPTFNEHRWPWMNRRSRIYWYDQYTLNDHEVAFRNYDPDRIADEMRNTGAEVIAVYAANQFSIAYYPSKIWPQHPNLDGRDYFGEVSSRLQAQGQKVIAYINWLESRHPEWYFVPLDGEPEKEFPLASWAVPDDPERRVQQVPGGRWRSCCINSPRREQVVAVTREIVERYHPDGFHLDMLFNLDVCVCPYCRPELERICGSSEITRESIKKNWRAFIDWRNACSSSLIAEVSGILHENGVFAAHNGQNPLWLSPIYGYGKDWLPHVDIYVSEIFYNLHASTLMMRWHNAVGKPSCELLTSTSPMHAHLSVPESAWQISAATARANGCDLLGPCCVGAYPDTTSAKRLLETAGSGLNLFMEHADLHDGAVPDAKVALVFSWATRQYFKEGQMNWSEEIDGWSQALMAEHVPFEFLIAESTTPEALRRFDLVLLPNVCHVSDDFCAAISRYVQDGGRVLAVGETSLGDEEGNRRAEFALSRVFGISWNGASEGPFAFEGPEEPEPALGIFQQVACSGTVLRRQFSTDPAGSVAGYVDPFPIEPTQWPVATIHDYGDGTALYVAFDLGKYYANRSLVHAHVLMADLVDRVLPSRQVDVKAPQCLEVTLWKQPDLERTIIHLANGTQASHDMPKVHEVIPIPDITIGLGTPVPDPVVTFRGTTGSIEIEQERIQVHLERVVDYAAIVIEPKSRQAESA